MEKLWQRLVWPNHLLPWCIQNTLWNKTYRNDSNGGAFSPKKKKPKRISSFWKSNWTILTERIIRKKTVTSCFWVLLLYTNYGCWRKQTDQNKKNPDFLWVRKYGIKIVRALTNIFSGSKTYGKVYRLCSEIQFHFCRTLSNRWLPIKNLVKSLLNWYSLINRLINPYQILFDGTFEISLCNGKKRNFRNLSPFHQRNWSSALGQTIIYIRFLFCRYR